MLIEPIGGVRINKQPNSKKFYFSSMFMLTLLMILNSVFSLINIELNLLILIVFFFTVAYLFFPKILVRLEILIFVTIEIILNATSKFALFMIFHSIVLFLSLIARLIKRDKFRLKNSKSTSFWVTSKQDLDFTVNF